MRSDDIQLIIAIVVPLVGAYYFLVWWRQFRIYLTKRMIDKIIGRSKKK